MIVYPVVGLNACRLFLATFRDGFRWVESHDINAAACSRKKTSNLYIRERTYYYGFEGVVAMASFCTVRRNLQHYYCTTYMLVQPGADRAFFCSTNCTRFPFGIEDDRESQGWGCRKLEKCDHRSAFVSPSGIPQLLVATGKQRKTLKKKYSGKL